MDLLSLETNKSPQVVETAYYQLAISLCAQPFAMSHDCKKNYHHGATESRKMFVDIFSRLDTIHQRVGQTDGQTDVRMYGRTPGDSKDGAYV